MVSGYLFGWAVLLIKSCALCLIEKISTSSCTITKEDLSLFLLEYKLNKDMKCIPRSTSIRGEFHNNFSGFDCCKYLILGEFKNQFCAYSAQPGKKCEPGSLFNTKLPVSLWFIYCFLVRGTNKDYVNIIDNFYVIVHAKRRWYGT